MAWLVAGLGNPGEAYARTRHNPGRMTLDVLAQAHRARLKKARFLPADVAEIHIGSEPVWLVTSTRFMNESGPAYASFAAKHAIEPEHVIAVHDELEIPAGELMLKFGGGSGGHNGLRSLTQALGTPSYLRVRIGIGRPPGRQDPADFVLQPLGKEGVLDLAVSAGRAADAVEALVSEGLESAQQRFNRGATSG
jgi:PTH1 family peptidyl-tRNA hydrolase